MTEMTELSEADTKCIRVGLVNNMPDSSLEATEKQFQLLLTEASEGLAVRLCFLSLPGVPRSERSRLRIRSCYSPVTELHGGCLDGLIVTGAEPISADLKNEPYWAELTELVDWARQNTLSSVWSCLAAHAAVLAMDGIRRKPFPDKLFGVFDALKVSDHCLTTGLPAHFRVPHSRWNNLPEDALTAAGYRLLACLKDGGPDTFIKQTGRSLFVFFQGHPEYEAVSLSLEYRRDIRRFLNRERESYPSAPRGYYDREAVAALARLEARARLERHPETFAHFPAANVRCTWSAEAVRWYRNWLQYLFEEKHKRLTGESRRTSYEPYTAVAAASPATLASEAEVR